MTRWSEIEAALDGVLSRRWYTNHGPLARQLESLAAQRFGVRHAIAATNPTIATLMLAEAMGLAGAVIVPSSAPPRCRQALRWAGLRVVIWDEAKGIENAAQQLRPGIAGVLCAGGANAAALAELAVSRSIAFLRDGGSAHPGPSVIAVPCCGDDAGIALVTTNDDRLAATLRNIRSSYGAGAAVPVARTANGRLSELQAAVALLAFG